MKPPLARAIDAALPRGRNVTVALGGPSTTRSFAYNTRMNRLFDKSIVLACCIAAAMGLAVDARLVAAFCLGVIATSLAEVAQGNRARRAGKAASYAYIIAAVFVPPFVPFAPLALYDIARRVHRERIWPALAIGAVLVCALVADLRGGVLTTRTLLLTAILSVAATLLSLRTAQLEREQKRMRRTRDKLQERALALEARNRDLADRQDYEVELATLAERARIAREIHDNVGHQLTRASLQAEALRVVHADEPGVAADFADVKRTVDEALQLVRTSVHALNDNAVDLSVQLERIVEGTRSDGGPQIELEVMAEHAPANVANCFAAVLREALSNTMRHACAQTVTVRCMEHPSFYQLIVTDDGVGEVQASGRGTAEGMGLTSMRERIEALGGTFTAGPRAGAGGWRVFATVPKQQGDEGR
ncbi:sensor histidine kinase [Collinsella aerofaciens]|uniref:sensor histidine kinase n=1 Tax=Collinsella aerofaciens TaxID=74426 RepID=UPI00232CB9B9|nr:histidine kinase [Collinsella aerofaciens]MDB1917967.1 histidine kinase [Collinsella aerofaciens]